MFEKWWNNLSPLQKLDISSWFIAITLVGFTCALGFCAMFLMSLFL